MTDTWVWLRSPRSAWIWQPPPIWRKSASRNLMRSMWAGLLGMVITCLLLIGQKRWWKRLLLSSNRMLPWSSWKLFCATSRQGCSSFLRLLGSLRLEQMERRPFCRPTRSSSIWIVLFLKARTWPTPIWCCITSSLRVNSSPKKSATGGTGPLLTLTTSRESTTRMLFQTISQTTIWLSTAQHTMSSSLTYRWAQTSIS